MSENHETAMSAALGRAGFDTGVRLHAVIADLLKQSGGGWAKVREKLWQRLQGDTELRDEALTGLIAAVATDMRGDAGAVMTMPKGQAMYAPATNGDAAGQSVNAEKGQDEIARPPPQSREEGADDSLPKGRSVNAPSREPSEVQIRAAGKVAKAAAQTALDTFSITLRQGSRQMVGDILVSSYPTLVRRLNKRRWVSDREYNLVYLLNEKAEKFAHIPPGHTTRDVFSADDVKGMIKIAAALALPISEDGKPNA